MSICENRCDVHNLYLAINQVFTKHRRLNLKIKWRLRRGVFGND